MKFLRYALIAITVALAGAACAGQAAPPPGIPSCLAITAGARDGTLAAQALRAGSIAATQVTGLDVCRDSASGRLAVEVTLSDGSGPLFASRGFVRFDAADSCQNAVISWHLQRGGTGLVNVVSDAAKTGGACS